MGNLKTSVVNRTEVVLTIADFYKSDESNEMYGRERYALPAGGTKTIHSGKFAVAYNKRLKALDYNWRCDQQIHVCSCQHVLLVLTDEDFQKNKERELVLDMLDHRLRYAFVCPSTSVDHHWIWIWGEPSVCSLAELKLQSSIWSKQGLEIGRMDDLKTTVVNKTKLQLVLWDGREVMRVRACGRTTVPSGKLCKKKTQQKIYVHTGVRNLFVLEQSEFQENKGKELILETVEDRFRYAFVYPTVTPDDDHWIWSKDRSECSIAELIVEQRIWSEKGLHSYWRGVKNLETTIVNNTELLLTFMELDRHSEKSSFAGEGFGVGAGERKTIRSGKFLKVKWGRYWSEIQVWSGQHIVLFLYPDDFLNNKGKQLILEVSDQRLSFAFAYPTFLPIHWTQSGQMELSVDKLSQLMQEEQRLARDEECKSFKTRVVNKTDFRLTLVDVELGGGSGNPMGSYYGRKVIKVSESGTKSICSGDFFKKPKRSYPHLKEIRVLRAQQLMLTLNSNHFHDKQGKLLILDMPHGRLTHAFCLPTSATYNYPP